MNTKVCIVIPIYKNQLNIEEEYAVDRIVSVFSERMIYFVAPNNLEKDYYERRYPSVQFVQFSRRYFLNTKSYNKLMLNTNFYLTFEQYEYIAIIQPDVMLLCNEDKLDAYLDDGFDYAGGGIFARARNMPHRYSWKKNIEYFSFTS